MRAPDRGLSRFSRRRHRWFTSRRFRRENQDGPRERLRPQPARRLHDVSPSIDAVLARLNPQQRQAATHDERPLLIVAGAGTGKTATLVQRVAWLIAQGVEPSRILLLTFTRRAAAEMLRRVDSLLRHLDVADAAATASGAAGPPAAASLRGTRVWGGTFHAVATRLLRRYGKAIGLPANFTIHDRGDSDAC